MKVGVKYSGNVGEIDSVKKRVRVVGECRRSDEEYLVSCLSGRKKRCLIVTEK